MAAPPPDTGSIETLATIMFFIGLGLEIIVSRREFYRRNKEGIEEFKSFSHMALTSTIEGLARVIGKLLLLGGALLWSLLLMFSR